MFGLTDMALSQAPAPVDGLAAKGISVQEISKTGWGSTHGLPYRKVPGANLGITSFEWMGNNQSAFLSDASNEILLIQCSTGNITNRFPVIAGPRDLVFDQGNFYVLGDGEVYVYDLSGQLVSHKAFPAALPGVGRIARYNAKTWLLLPSGNSVELESGTRFKGWITGSGNFVSTALQDAHSYAVEVTGADGKTSGKVFRAEYKTAGVYVVGATADKVVLDVQLYLTESPVRVERHLVTVSYTPGSLGEITSDIRIPDCYYVLSDKEFSLGSDGTVYEMITAPDGLSLFSLSETPADKANPYPESIQAIRYHFNDHLLQMKESK